MSIVTSEPAAFNNEETAISQTTVTILTQTCL